MKTTIFYQLIFQQKLATLINCAISKRGVAASTFYWFHLLIKLIGGLLAIQNVPKVWVYWILKQRFHRLSFLHFNFCSKIFRNQIQNDFGFFWWPFTDYSVENDEIFWHSKDFTWNQFSELFCNFKIFGASNDVFKLLKLIFRKFWMAQKICKFPHCLFGRWNEPSWFLCRHWITKLGREKPRKFIHVLRPNAGMFYNSFGTLLK